MNEDRIWLLISLRLSGEATAAELDELEVLLRDHASVRMKLALMEQSWKTRQAPKLLKEAAFNRHLQRLSQHLNEDVLRYEAPADTVAENEATVESPRRPLLRRMVWATGIAASLMAAWFFVAQPYLSKNANDIQAQNTVSTKRGSKSKVQLPDGTQVWLNADSRITYNENFLGKERVVNLTGEAYFDVVRDEERPFVIHTNVIDIRVLGTAFNVRSYADELNTETSLVRGSVEVTIRNHPEKKFTLKPNDKLIINNKQALPTQALAEDEKTSSREIVLTWGKINYASKQDTVATEAMWTRNKLAFDKEKLEDIALRLERWYDISVEVEGEKLQQTEFSMIVEDESLQQVLEALRTAGKFRYTIDKKKVLIRP
ncbi:MAG: FecR family protein [Chitinophagaceae bacterium]